MTATLLTFAPMVDAELARLVLAHHRVRYREERHVFGWASVLAFWRGATVQIPMLHGNGPALAGPRAMVDHFDQLCPAARQLVPARQPGRTEIEADWDRYNGRLATSTATFAYYHLLPRKDLMVDPLSRGLPSGEATALRSWYYPALRWQLSTLLRLDAVRAGDALTQIRAAMDRSDRLLSDQRTFLHGDLMTLADLALSAALAPMLAMPRYATLVPDISLMPAVMADAIQDSRSRPTARLVERVYAAIEGEPRFDRSMANAPARPAVPVG